MARLKRFLHRTLALLPSLLLAASWPALWMVWPRGGPADDTRSDGVRACRARYVSGENTKLAVYLRPDLFGRGSDGNVSESAVDTHSDASTVMTVKRPAQTLSWDAEEGHHRLTVNTTTSAEQAGRALSELVVMGEDEPVFPAVVPSALRLVVSADAPLTAAGFQVPEEQLPDELKQLEEPWGTRFWVELGGDDGVGHVVMERGTGKDRLDRLLMGMVAGALPGKRNERVSGWVTIEYRR